MNPWCATIQTTATEHWYSHELLFTCSMLCNVIHWNCSVWLSIESYQGIFSFSLSMLLDKTYLKKNVSQVMQQNYNRTNTEETSCVRKCCQHDCDYVMNDHLPKILQNRKISSILISPIAPWLLMHHRTTNNSQSSDKWSIKIG